MAAQAEGDDDPEAAPKVLNSSKVLSYSRNLGFCTDDEYQEFLRSCPVFEDMLTRSGIILVKYWFSVSDDVQEDRFQERLGSYFNLVQPYQHHTNVPATGINVYSFALKPEEHQPSGTCNMSRIDSAVLQLQLTPKAAGQQASSTNVNDRVNVGSKIRVYATNYNVLRVMSGMGGLAYSN